MPAISAQKTPHQRPLNDNPNESSTNLLETLKRNYKKQSNPVCRLLDVYLLFCLANGILTAIYYLAVGSFNYNAFLGSFISSVGSFVFAANLRLKCSLPDKGTSLQTSYIAEYLCSIASTLNLIGRILYDKAESRAPTRIMSTNGSRKSLEEKNFTPTDASAKKDRFSKNYKNIFQGAGSRISSLFLKPTAEPTVRPQPELPKEIIFKKFKTFKKLPSGTKISEVDAATHSAIVNGDYSTDKPGSKKPSGISTKEWFAVNAYLMYNSAIRYYGWLSQHCTENTCPRMTAGARYEFKWADGKKLFVPRSTPAPEYAMNVLIWVEYQFKDVAIFPNYDGAYYSRHRFLPVVQDIFKRLLRIYAHILSHHMDALKLAQVDKEFVKFLRHFLDLFDRYDLLVEKDVKPVTRSMVWFNIINNS